MMHSDVRAERFAEPAHDVPLAGEVDVIVCGGGPAGFAAAIAAARTGARTLLFDMHGCLGGTWTAGLLTWTFEFDRPGLTAELRRRLERCDARRGTRPGTFVYEVEAMKLLLEQMCIEAGVGFQLFTRVAAAYRDDARRLGTVITESKSGRQAWRARAFIDATGDGDLAAQAGCGWDYGYRVTGQTQPLTFNALITVRDAEAVKECVSFWGGDISWRRKAVEALRAEFARAGFECSYGKPTIFQMRDSLLTLMINHEYGVAPFDAKAMTAATVRARQEVGDAIAALRSLGGPWDGVQLVATAEQIGVREGRRIHGRYTVTRDDLERGARHDDAVARVTFGVDVHAATREVNAHTPISRMDVKTLPYDIPLRALIAREVDGLLLAGRCISGDFLAHASYRVTGTAVAMGQAAGAAGALAALGGALPHELPWPDVARATAAVAPER